MNTPHVVIIGAGFAGLSAARELQTLGISTEIIEARDRIGGRAWTENRLGHDLELGATWVHWMQPHTWAEISRYRQEIYASPFSDRAYWLTDGELKEGTEEELDAKIARPMAKIFERAREYFPNPYEPLHVLSEEFTGPESVREQFLADDATGVLDCLRNGEFTQEEIDLCDSYWSAGYIGDPNEGSSLMAKQWVALSDFSLSLLDAQTLRYKLKNGMKGLYESIAGDLSCPIRLSTPVKKVEHGPSSASVELENGETIACDAVIVTAPLGALPTIDFAPALPEAMQRLVEQKWNSTGCKIWIKVRGHHNVFAYAPTPSKLAMIRSEYFLEDDSTILVGFGSQHSRVDLEDPASVQEIVAQWLPDLEVLDCTGHDWVADRWSGQAWATLKKGQFTEGWHRFRETGTRLRFAGADWAKGWRGVVVDGALEVGISTARELAEDLS